MVDTCQAASMYDKFYSPNILAVASSLVGEDSLSVINENSQYLILKEELHSIFAKLIVDFIFNSIMLTPVSASILLIATHITLWNF